LSDDRRFRRHITALWFGQLSSAIGDRLHEIALVWIAVEAVGSGAGWVVAAGSVSRLLFGLIGGVYADRLDRQWLMVGCDLLRALPVAGLALLDLSVPGALWWLGAVAFWVGALDSFFQPALQASLPLLAPEPQRLQAANAWLDVTRRLALALGPAATGGLLALLPLPAFFALDAATFAGSGAVLLALGRGYAWKPRSRPPSSLLSQVREGAVDAWSNRTLRYGLAQNALWNLGTTPALSVGAALIVKDELGAGPEWFGYVTAAYGVGNVTMNLLMTRLEVRHTARMLHLGALVAGIGWMLFSQTTHAGLLLVVTALTAASGPMADLMLLRLIQTEFASERIGRVFSLRFTVSRTAQALGLASAVPLYGWLGPRTAIAIGAGALTVFALLRLLAVRRAA
jgi:hypothetical protein